MLPVNTFADVKRTDLIFVAIMLFAGIVMRLIWVGDMEWKDDEKIMYQLAHETAAKGEFPSVGMMSGGGVVNPGLSVALFALIAKFTSTPLQMVRIVQLSNVAAILLLLLFIFKRIQKEERRTWFLGLALAAVSPLAILFSRKIWAQDLLPIFTLFLIIGNSYRKQPIGAFIYGVAAMLIGQLHMSGFFLAAGIISFSFLYDLYHHIKIKWLSFIAGATFALIPAIPWIRYITTHESGSYLILDHVLQLAFYIYSFLDMHGLNIQYTMEAEYAEFLKYPTVNGYSLFIPGILFFTFCAAALLTVGLIAKYFINNKEHFRRSRIIAYIFNCSDARFYLQAIFIGHGLLLTLSGTEIYPHYLICLFPFTYLFLAKVYEKHTVVLKTIIVMQLFLSMLFLKYVHDNNGVREGDYGMTYDYQVKAGIQ